MKRPEQTPVPGSHVLLHRGDVIEFELRLPCEQNGGAWLRTNLDNARVRREELIWHGEGRQPLLARDWRDIPMRQINAQHYSLAIPLLDVGRFEAKTFFLPDDHEEPIWPEGGNVVIKVEPAEYCCTNTIYTAFVRQFGPNQYRRSVSEEQMRAVQELETAGYAVIPRSGTFRDLIRELDFIIGKLRCRIIQLLPIHPTPTTYARMGRFGSSYAVLDFKDVDPALAEFDRRTTPMDQFRELVETIHERYAKLFIDIPVNHTGWASKLQISHPEWFARDCDRRFESPRAWGVTWEDLSKLDYKHRELWEYIADVFLFWCGQGVDGFRCDAAYMVPYPVWEYVAAKVRQEYPDTIFMLEGLGGKPETVEELLSGANLDWAYSELFQNYDQNQIESYLPGCIHVSSTKGILVHFAETHDNVRLAARSMGYARLRTALAALCSHNGGFGITNGVEWFADEKIDVHGASSLNWGSKENQIDHIARLNAILEAHPAFHAGARLRLVHQGHHNSIALLRENPMHGAALLILVNLNEKQQSTVSWNSADFPSGGKPMHDLLTGNKNAIEEGGGKASCSLAPAEALCLTRDSSDLQKIERVLHRAMALPERSHEQCLRAKALEVYAFYHRDADVSEFDPAQEAQELAGNPQAFCGKIAGDESLSKVVAWEWPRDTKRTVMVPPGYFLYINSAHHFIAELRDAGKVVRRETSLRQDDGSHFVLILPVNKSEIARKYTLTLTVYEPGKPCYVQAQILYLSTGRNTLVRTCFDRDEVQKLNCYALCTNSRGAMAQVRGAWGEIRSQYDALLAGNLHPDYPVDRRIMLTRCRAWLVYRGYSQEINNDCLESFALDKDGAVNWRFAVPAGEGKIISLDVCLRMHKPTNAITVGFYRRRLRSSKNHLANANPVKIIVRPDIEDRVCHEKTKAYTEPEKWWPGAVSARESGFSFAPATDHRLEVSLSGGTYTVEPEWTYMVAHSVEAERGLDDSSDLFSPGYFIVSLKGGECCVLKACVVTEETVSTTEVPTASGALPQARVNIPLNQALLKAMQQFVVKRDDSKTVIAGYPWFLDWGRDTLICLRGIIAAGRLNEARDILNQFGRYEEQGTLPNMIRGNNDSNRDTSDAPLWFFVACRDLMNAECHVGGRVAKWPLASKKRRGRMRNADCDFLESDCGGRTLREVLVSIAENYVKGTPNGIKMDPQSGLIFSPSHFTWMDTNYPAGSPREGYPIEIQALWHSALRFLATLEPDGKWQSLAALARESILKYFPMRGAPDAEHRTPRSGASTEFIPPRRDTEHFLSDCLHAKPGQAAKQAVPDDHLRPNQLLAITLGAISDKAICPAVLASCEELLVPGAIRTLADRRVTYSLPIHHFGRLLNDPSRPYWGSYYGDEDTRRKPAYHNGTAWTWLFPSYTEALFMTYGDQVRDAALAILSSSTEIINQGCIGQVPEIVDGDAPHTLRGCGAQAWGVTELYRVLAILTKKW